MTFVFVPTEARRGGLVFCSRVVELLSSGVGGRRNETGGRRNETVGTARGASSVEFKRGPLEVPGRLQSYPRLI
jgi:hypothetical protein